jgi:hypothetical protein
MHVAPEHLLELRVGDDLAGIGQQQTKRGQLPGRKVDQCLSTEEGAIGFEP